MFKVQKVNHFESLFECLKAFKLTSQIKSNVVKQSERKVIQQNRKTQSLQTGI